MLAAKALTKTLGNTQVLHGIDIQIEPGTITTLVGPSGCGKSTLLRALALLDPPTTGEFQLEDVELRFPTTEPLPTDRIWPKLSVVFQQLFLWPHLTLRQNALLPLRTRGIRDAEDRVNHYIHSLELNGFADRYPNEVSIGQRQLGAIARALALEPRYLLLDEITSALDVEYVAMMLERLLDLRDGGVAILLVSHFLDFARKSSDQVVFLDQGKIVESGVPAILNDPKTPRLERFLGLVRGAR